jgi:hypothetical protein
MEGENTSLKDEIKKLNDNFTQLVSEKKIKKIKGKKLSRGQLKKNYVRYLYIDENRNMKAMKVPIDEGIVSTDGVPRIATTDYMLTWDGQPTIIQPSWSLKPFDPVVSREETTKDKMNSAGIKLILKRIEEGTVNTKKKLSGAVIFGIVIAIIVVGYILLRGGG